MEENYLKYPKEVIANIAREIDFKQSQMAQFVLEKLL